MKKDNDYNIQIKPILAQYIPMADMLVQTFGADCEVVLHDLYDPQRSVVYVANNKVTGRKIGESFDHLVKQVIISDELQDDFVANYYFKAKDGRLIRSSTLLIRNESNKLEGALCINLDTSRLSEHIAYLQSFLPALPAPYPKVQQEIRKDEVVQMVTLLIDSIIGDCQPQTLSREERIEKIRFMESRGIFMVKGSVEQVAEKLGINKVTVYSYLDEVRGKRGCRV